METVLKTLGVILTLVVVIVVVTFFVKNRSVPVKYDKNGFPIQPAPKEGDRFVLKADGKTYIYTGGKWIILVVPNPDETVQERVIPNRSAIKDYTNVLLVNSAYTGRISSDIRCYEKVNGFATEQYIKVLIGNIWTIWKLFSETSMQSCYKRVGVGLHKCDLGDNLLAGHGVHGSCIGSNGGTINY